MENEMYEEYDGYTYDPVDTSLTEEERRINIARIDRELEEMVREYKEAGLIPTK